MKILVIDPDKAMRDVLIKTLGAIMPPFSPLEAESIDGESLSLIASEKPEIIFLDYDCFADDPSGTINQIKKNSASSKIILISGVGADEKVVQAAIQTKGARLSMIAKPYNGEDIRKAIALGGQVEDKAEKNPQGTITADKTKSSAGDNAKSGTSKRRKLFPVLFGFAFIIVAAFLFFYRGNLLKSQPRTSASFSTSVKNPSYLSATTDGEVVITDWQEETIYFYKTPSSPLEKSLIPLYSVKVKEVQPSAACIISSDSKSVKFVVADGLQGMFFVIKSELPAGAAPSVVSSGIIIGSYKAPGATPSGLLVLSDRKEIWSYDSTSQKLYCHSLPDFSVKKIYELPVTNPAGITFMNNKFYVGESNTGRIIELNPSDMSISSIIKPRIYTSTNNTAGGEHLLGVASDGRNLWSISESGTVYRHHPSEFETTIK